MPGFIKLRVSERSICGEFKTHFEKFINENFDGYYCDIEYNRNLNGQIKTIINENLEVINIQCDLIIHSRGEKVEQDNILALEMKKSSRPQEEKVKDKNRLIALTKQTFGDTWSFDGVSLPEHVCRYILGIYYEIDEDDKTVLLEFYERGQLISSEKIILKV